LTTKQVCGHQPRTQPRLDLEETVGDLLARATNDVVGFSTRGSGNDARQQDHAAKARLARIAEVVACWFRHGTAPRWPCPVQFGYVRFRRTAPTGITKHDVDTPKEDIPVTSQTPRPDTDTRRRILLVEDEDKTACDLERGLRGEGYDVEVSTTGEEGFYRASTEALDLVILDVRLPGRDGFEVLHAVRSIGIVVPILMLTACDTTDDLVRGLDTGADDYLVKPYSFAELLARVRVLLRRTRPNDDTATLSVDSLVVDVKLRRVSRRGKPIELTTRELDLLIYLLRHRNQIVSREMLARDVWRETMRATSLDNVIDVHMTRLRKKIDRWPDHKLIQTVRGVGFIVRVTEQ